MGRPKYKVVAKSKRSGEFQDLVALWENEKGVSGQLDRDVEKIVLKSGRVITNEACYINLQINTEDGEPASLPDESERINREIQEAADHPGDEIPF